MVVPGWLSLPLANWAWPLALAVVIIVIVVAFRREIRALMPHVTGFELPFFKVSFDQGLQDIHRDLRSHTPRTRPVDVAVDQADYQRLRHELRNRLENAHRLAKHSPVESISLAGGAFRQLVEGAASLAGVDLSKNSSRLVALAYQGLDKNLVYSALALTQLEVRAMLEDQQTITERDAEFYAQVVQDLSESVLDFSVKKSQACIGE